METTQEPSTFDIALAAQVNGWDVVLHGNPDAPKPQGVIDVLALRRSQKQSRKAKKRNARKAALAGKWPLDKKEAVLARFAERSKGKSTKTAKALNEIAQEKELGHIPRLRAEYDPSKRYGTKPPRGRALDIPYLGHLRVQQNPALKVWEAKERERIMWSQIAR